MFDKGYLLGGRYKIISLLGEGGMANVYLAEDIILQRKVAVKVLRRDLQKDPQTIQRFQREALAMSELSHPHIVSIFDVGSDHNRHYLVMEYVDGPDLEQYIQNNKPLALKTVISIMDQILDAMALAHKHNVIHRDLKPQNILLDKHGNIKIVDFGIAVALNQSTMTQTNTAMGSVHYMSPEQARGSIATKQSDIYSLGIILYELLMGQVPFGGDNPVTIALKHFQEPIPSLRKQNEAIPQALENVVLKATSKDPRDRYNSIIEMKKDLDTSLDQSRKDEPVFVPKHNPTQDETIVLPDMSGKVTNTQEVEKKENPKSKKLTVWETIKKYKWWWISLGAAFLGIMVILIFALGRKDNVNVPNVANLSQDQARDSILAAGLKIGKTEKEYSSSVKKGYLISTSPNSGSSVKSGSTINLIVSRGPRLIKVPDVSGYTYSSAKKKLEGLGFSVTRTYVYSSSKKGEVVGQDVVPGEKVNPDKTTIDLSVSRGRRRSSGNIKIRDLTGYSLTGAQDYARDNGLVLRTTEEYSDSVDKGLVMKQSPAPGTTVGKGATLNLIISRGKKEDSESSNSSSQSENSDNVVTKSFTVPYQTATGSSQSSGSASGNHIQIYISDDDHSIGNLYRDQYITNTATYSIPFNLSKGNGHIKIVRDGTTILDEDINK